MARRHEAVSGKQSGLTGRSALIHDACQHVLGQGQWARQCSMRSDARVSGECATKGLMGKACTRRNLTDLQKFRHQGAHLQGAHLHGPLQERPAAAAELAA